MTGIVINRKVIEKRILSADLDTDTIEEIVRQYFLDHIGEELKPNSIRWQLTGQSPVLIVRQEIEEEVG